MSAIRVETITRRERLLHLDKDAVLELRVERNEVGIYANGQEIGRLQFRPLMSANSAESSPLYSLEQASMQQDGLTVHPQVIADAAIELFREYTGATIRMPKGYEKLFELNNNA